MIKRWFVTGTDTEVGKTVASSALLQAANRAGYRSAGYKPVASGSEMTAEGLRNGDALALQANSGVALDYDEVNPYVFAEPTSPHIVSADEGRPIDAARLSDGLRGWSSAPTGCWSRAPAGGLLRCRRSTPSPTGYGRSNCR
ncbi:ATP-dependent dethiobiotin synthetase BioD 1 [Serratia marcescens]|uniref:Dethiobiotin synthase n=1 Tax=Serratia marcescens TaxID=615 RepID=A0A380AJW0_SERMA|nr:ATP-dependent dethiobiotin synthetase BioD 1 [Serratia marcescens]